MGPDVVRCDSRHLRPRLIRRGKCRTAPGAMQKGPADRAAGPRKLVCGPRDQAVQVLAPFGPDSSICLGLPVSV